MINFFFEEVRCTINKDKIANWIIKAMGSENKTAGDINFIFCKDNYLLKINQDYLNHDTYTDIITFDNSLGNQLNGDIYISIDRVNENAKDYKVEREEELRRVIVHGVLHMCGYKDKTAVEKDIMRRKEDEKLKLFHVEQ